MRSMKYLPSVSTLNSIKYFRQILNNSLQKFNTIDVNVIIDKYFNLSNNSNNNNKPEVISLKSNNTNIDNKSIESKTIDKSIDEKLLELSEKSNKTQFSDNKQLIEVENQLFETALKEWIESKNNLNSNKSPTNDDLRGDKQSNESSAPVSTSSSVSMPSYVWKSGLEMRTKQLLQSMATNDSVVNTKRRLQEFSKLLTSNPETISYAVKQNAIQKVLQLNHWSGNRVIQSHSQQVLALLGYTEPPKGTGIRILSIDGGGMRGILVIEILRELERLSGKPIHQLFDLICGVSTGAILGMLLGALQTSINECEEYYHKFSSNLFKSDRLRGAGRLIWTHAYYDTSVWQKILKDIYSETYLMETRLSCGTPNVVAISAIMNRPSIQAFLFRNYELPAHTRALSQYEGSSKYKIWEAVRASAAAPGYFEEFQLDGAVHQDGGILINNPTAVAIHEAKMLWPTEHIQCVVSLGSGRYIPPKSFETEDKNRVMTTSLKTKIIRLIDSATDTEMVHNLMKDLSPQNTYFRINPFLTEMGTLDENRPEKLDQMKVDARMYLRKNELKVKKAVKQLTKTRKFSQKTDDWLRLQYNLRI